MGRDSKKLAYYKELRFESISLEYSLRLVDESEWNLRRSDNGKG